MWHPSVRTFRWFTFLALVSHVIVVIDGQWVLLPAAPEFVATRDAWMAYDSVLTWDQHNRAYWLSNGVTALALIGMLRLCDWARWTALFVTVFNLAWWPLSGTFMCTPWQQALWNVWVVGYYSALAIAFLSPVALHFTGQMEVPGTVVDD